MRRLYRIFVVRLTLVATFSCAVATQSQWWVPSCYAPTSEAQQEADQKVSLSAHKIIEILRQDPGQLLQVKRMLIQKAYEQGRILESSDLTDEALFRLLREDEVVRALATRVVENRFYVRAKPARQEIEGKRPEVDDQSQGPEPDRPTQKSPTSDQVQRANGREDDDWSEQQRNTENHRRSRPGVESPLRPDRDPEISVPRNPARAVDRAELEQNPNIFENMGSDASRMARIHPEELAGLLSVVSPSSQRLLSCIGILNWKTLSCNGARVKMRN